MPKTLRSPCDVVACGRPAASSYLDAALARSVQFAVCDEHLSRLQAGQRPTILTEGGDVAVRAGRPALLFPGSTGAD
jgi:hypothetical protein